MDWNEYFLNVGVATILGACIGLERQVHQRKAGLRTNALVALGSAAFVTIGAFVPHEDSQSRVAASVVSGVGFLGAGVIFKDGLNIRGLDTAATIWCSAAVGALAGWGQLVVAAVTAAIVLLTNTLVRPMVTHIDRKQATAKEIRSYELAAVCAAADEHDVRDLLLAAVLQNDLSLRSVRRTKGRDGFDKVIYTITAEVVGKTAGHNKIEQAASQLGAHSRVASATWRENTPLADAAGNGSE